MDDPAKLRQAPTQVRLHTVWSKPELLGDLLYRRAVDVAKRQALSLAQRQLPERFVQRHPRARIHRLWWGPRAVDRAPLTAKLRPQMVKAEVPVTRESHASR